MQSLSVILEVDHRVNRTFLCFSQLQTEVIYWSVTKEPFQGYQGRPQVSTLKSRIA